MDEFIYILLYALQRNKRTALHYCVVHGYVSVAEGLIRAGTDVNAVDTVSLIVE